MKQLQSINISTREFCLAMMAISTEFCSSLTFCSARLGSFKRRRALSIVTLPTLEARKARSLNRRRSSGVWGMTLYIFAFQRDSPITVRRVQLETPCQNHLKLQPRGDGPSGVGKTSTTERPASQKTRIAKSESPKTKIRSCIVLSKCYYAVPFIRCIVEIE